jgi:Pentapeptide repeats (8 copies)
MLRRVSFVVAVAAILAIPFSNADARNGGHRGGGMRMGGGGVHFSGARFSGARFSGARFSGTRFSGTRFHGARIAGPRFATGRVGRVRVAPRRVFVAGPRFRHHRRFIYSVGLYDSCWRWVPSVYGLRRVWVCDPYSSYYYY